MSLCTSFSVPAAFCKLEKGSAGAAQHSAFTARAAWQASVRVCSPSVPPQYCPGGSCLLGPLSPPSQARVPPLCKDLVSSPSSSGCDVAFTCIKGAGLGVQSLSLAAVQPAESLWFLFLHISLAMILCFQVTSGDIKLCQAQHPA